MQIKIKGKGILHLGLSSFDGCCGLSIIAEPGFGLIKGRSPNTREEFEPYIEAFKKEMSRSFGDKDGDYKEEVGSVMITDIIGGFLYKMCKFMDMKAIHKTRNPKTNRIVYLFAYRVNKL